MTNMEELVDKSIRWDSKSSCSVDMLVDNLFMLIAFRQFFIAYLFYFIYFAFLHYSNFLFSCKLFTTVVFYQILRT